MLITPKLAFTQFCLSAQPSVSSELWRQEASPWPEPQDWSHSQPTLRHYNLWDFFFLFFISCQGFCHNPKCRKVREYKLSPVVLSLWQWRQWVLSLSSDTEWPMLITFTLFCLLPNKREAKKWYFVLHWPGKRKPWLEWVETQSKEAWWHYRIFWKGRYAAASPAEQHAESLWWQENSSLTTQLQETAIVTQRQSPLFLGWLSGEAVSAKREVKM